MTLLALLDGPDGSIEPKSSPLGRRHVLVRAPSWGGLARLVRDRPVSGVVVDLAAMEIDAAGHSGLDGLKARFPRLPAVVAIDSTPDPRRLLLLGRLPGIRVLMGSQLRSPSVVDDLLEGQFRTGPRRIPVLLGQLLPPWHALALSRAVDRVDEGWSADDFSDAMNVRRPCLSRRLQEAGLPSAGSLLTWIKLFYAAWWLPDPGRTAGSVASQLEYSSSQALVRAVRRRLGVTPGELIANGGLSWAWLRFLNAHPALAKPQSPATGVRIAHSTFREGSRQVGGLYSDTQQPNDHVRA